MLVALVLMLVVQSISVLMCVVQYRVMVTGIRKLQADSRMREESLRIEIDRAVEYAILRCSQTKPETRRRSESP